MPDKLKPAQRKLVEHVRANSKDGAQLDLLAIVDHLAPRELFSNVPGAASTLEQQLADSIAMVQSKKNDDIWPGGK